VTAWNVDVIHCSTTVHLCKFNERRDREIYRQREIGEHKVMMAGPVCSNNIKEGGGKDVRSRRTRYITVILACPQVI
jgi:hypothetical protein